MTIAEQAFQITQSAAATLTIDPPSATVTHGESKAFTAYLNGVPNNGLQWSVSGVGTISSGLYTAPSIIQPDQTYARITAAYPPGNATAFADVFLVEYAPPNALSVSPNSSSQLIQTFTFTAGDVHGASAIDSVSININSGIDQFYAGCYLEVHTLQVPGDPWNDTAELALDGSGGWSSPIRLGTAGTLENAQCRLDTGASSITRAGNYVNITLVLRVRPGFLGVKGTYMRARNTTGATTAWQQVGTWNLAGNVASGPPTLALDSPAAGATVQGDVTISGWALDSAALIDHRISGVQVLIDGQSAGTPTYGTSRPDICNVYPGREGCPNVGYTFAWNTRNWSNGTHTIQVTAFDTDNPVQTAQVTRTVTVYNPPPPMTIAPSLASVRIFVPSIYPRLPFEQQQFTASVSGTPVSDVNWSLSQTNTMLWGSVSTAGLYLTPSYWYGAQAGASLQVIGVRQSNPAQTGSATITLLGAMASDRLTINPGEPATWFRAVGQATLTRFTLEPAIGSIDSYGWYTPPSSGSYNTEITVRARDAANAAVIYMTKFTLR